MFITENQIAKRAARIMVREGSAKFGTVKPVSGRLSVCDNQVYFSNDNGIILYKKCNIDLHENRLTVYVGEIHLKCDGTGIENGWRNWHYVFGITNEGKLILWAN